MEQKEVNIERPNSVEISINAKGQYSGKVKCYEDTIEEAFNKAKEYSDKLKELIKQQNE
ncbi:MAG: hypothetical protein ACTSX6_04675 [Candidatus Heimdallarchaeaceae archaeon]